MICLATLLVAAMTSADAIVTVLNTAAACGPRTFAEAKAKVEEDAREGRPLQQFVVAVTTDDAELAKRYAESSRSRIVEMAEKKNNPLAWYLLSAEKNDAKSLRRAAEGGNVQALNALGALVIQQTHDRLGSMPTNEVSALLQKSFGYFSQAAAQRDANGFINLGTCYLSGIGCAKDYKMAFSCFKAAAELGHPEGMDYLSASYELGNGVPKSEERSLYWKMRGRAARGDEAADRWLRERK